MANHCSRISRVPAAVRGERAGTTDFHVAKVAKPWVSDQEQSEPPPISDEIGYRNASLRGPTAFPFTRSLVPIERLEC
ncbi:MAG: hypothetical protein JWM11_3180 [Planctomycetaceae bacterium]|nr:hypothetical protein [Planctomycetaceae bacterium]